MVQHGSQLVLPNTQVSGEEQSLNGGRTRDTSLAPAPGQLEGNKGGQREGEKESEFVFSWGKCARYLGFLAAGGCRRGRLLGARRLLGQPVHAVLAGAARRDHRGGAGTVLGSRRNSEARLPPAHPPRGALGRSAPGPGDSHPRPPPASPRPRPCPPPRRSRGQRRMSPGSPRPPAPRWRPHSRDCH